MASTKKFCERQTCAAVLADAFAEDPVFLWFGPKKAYDVSIRKLMGIFLWALGESYDLCDVARNEHNGDIVSVALWEPATPHFAAVLRSIVLVVSFFWVCGLWKGLEAARFFLTLEHEVRAPNGGPVVVLMRREPRAAKPSRRWTTHN